MRLPDLSAIDPRPLPSPLPLWPPLIAATGPGSESTKHAHHGMHFVLARTGLLRIRLGGDEAPVEAAGVLTAPDIPHAVESGGNEVLIVFLDPESSIGSDLAAAMCGPAHLFEGAQRDQLIADGDPLALMGVAGVDWVHRAAALLGLASPAAGVRRIHPKVRRVLEIVADGSCAETDLTSLATRVQLSPGRLMHAFTESIGIPFRPYIAWLKLQRACAAIRLGMPLADAALAGGFADAAHMTRTMRKMLGVRPSQVRPPRATDRDRP